MRHTIPRKPVPSRRGQENTSDLCDEDLPEPRVSPSHPQDGLGLHTSGGLHANEGLTTARLPTMPTVVNKNQKRTRQDAQLDAEPVDSLLSGSSLRMSKFVPKHSRFDWVPSTLRWPFLLSLILLSLVLSATVGLLTWYSASHNGLGTDTSSDLLLFGWRFTPTLIAVAYVLLETMLLVDIRRTEAYARLARNRYASAASTLLLADGSWWHDPREALKKQNNGRWKSWALFWASIANMFGMFAISPLSAGLLFVTEVQIMTPTEFKRIAAFDKIPLQATADDGTYVRSIAGSIQGLKPSAWLSDEYVILPFWPSYLGTVPTGSTLALSDQSWKGVTTIFQLVWDCESMWLSEAGFQTFENSSNVPSRLVLVFYTAHVCQWMRIPI